MSANINDAIKDLKSELAGGKEYTPELLKQIADDWEVNPALLIRGFKTATGKDPSEFHIADKAGLDQKMLARAIEKAKLKAKAYRGGVDISGKTFTYDNKAGKKAPAVAIAFTRDGLEHIDVNTGNHMVLHFPNQNAAWKYLEKHIL